MRLGNGCATDAILLHLTLLAIFILLMGAEVFGLLLVDLNVAQNIMLCEH